MLIIIVGGGKELKLEDVLSFATCVKAVPAIGLVPSPALAFHNTSPLPLANTCSNILTLSLKSKSYVDFQLEFVYGIMNAIGFGQVDHFFGVGPKKMVWAPLKGLEVYQRNFRRLFSHPSLFCCLPSPLVP